MQVLSASARGNAYLLSTKTFAQKKDFRPSAEAARDYEKPSRDPRKKLAWRVGNR